MTTPTMPSPEPAGDYERLKAAAESVLALPSNHAQPRDYLAAGAILDALADGRPAEARKVLLALLRSSTT